MTTTTRPAGFVTLFVDGLTAGRIDIPDLGGIAVRGGADVAGDHLSPVTSSYEAPFEFTGTIHVVDVKITPRLTVPRAMTPEEESEAS